VRGSDNLQAVQTSASASGTSVKYLTRGPDAADAAVREYLAKAEMHVLEHRCASEVASFDEALALLLRNKMQLDVAIKMIELRL